MERLKLERDRLLNDPAYIEEIARKEYGMFGKDEEIFQITLPDSGKRKSKMTDKESKGKMGFVFKLRNYFTTGLLILAPTVVSIWVFMQVFRFSMAFSGDFTPNMYLPDLKNQRHRALERLPSQ